MTFWVAGAAIGGSLLGAYASNKSAKTQAQAADRAADLQSDVADKSLALQERMYEEGIARQQPFLKAGVNALGRMQRNEFALPAAFNPNDPAYKQPGAFTFTSKDFQADPGYAFRLAEGQKALDRQAAARGGLISGGALKAAARYGQDMGSQEFQNAYNRAYTGYGTKVQQADTGFNRALTGYNANVARADTGYNRLASMAGIGQTTTDKINAAGQNYASSAGNIMGNMATNVGNAYGAAGQARASGYMGAANAITGGVSQYLGYQQNNNLINALNQNRRNSSYMSEPYSGYNAQIGLG
jgi:hypothetical protein